MTATFRSWNVTLVIKGSKTMNIQQSRLSQSAVTANVATASVTSLQNACDCDFYPSIYSFHSLSILDGSKSRTHVRDYFILHQSDTLGLKCSVSPATITRSSVTVTCGSAPYCQTTAVSSGAALNTLSAHVASSTTWLWRSLLEDVHAWLVADHGSQVTRWGLKMIGTSLGSLGLIATGAASSTRVQSTI